MPATSAYRPTREHSGGPSSLTICIASPLPPISTSVLREGLADQWWAEEWLNFFKNRVAAYLSYPANNKNDPGLGRGRRYNARVLTNTDGNGADAWYSPRVHQFLGLLLVGGPEPAPETSHYSLMLSFPGRQSRMGAATACCTPPVGPWLLLRPRYTR